MVAGVGRRYRTFGDAREPRAQHLRSRELDAGMGAEALRLQVADPERAVHCADADRSLALREELAGPAAQTILFVRAVQEDLLADQRRIEHAGTAVSRADPRTIRAVGSLDQSMARSACFMAGLSVPRTSGRR